MQKKWLHQIAGVMLAGAVLLSAGCRQHSPQSAPNPGSGTSVPASSEAGKQADITSAGFPAAERWQPEEFVISTLLGIPYGSVESQNKRAVKYHKEAYFNTIELVNLSGEDMEMALQTCREQGVKVIIGDPGLMPGSNLGEEEILQKMQDYAAYDDTIRGFFICDEPHHKQELFTEISDWTDRLRKLAPAKLMYSNLFPSYGVYTWAGGKDDYRQTTYAQYVDDFIRMTDPDVLSVDYYVFAHSTSCEADLDRNNWWRDWGYFRQRSIETDKPFWCYIQSLGEFAVKKEIGNMTAERIAVQVNTAVAYGAKGVSYYNSLCSLIDERAYKTSLYEGIQRVNQGAMTYGSILLDKNYDELYHTSVPEALQGPYFSDNLKESKWFTALPDNTLVSTFTDDKGEVYLMVVNRSYDRRVQGNVELKSPRNIVRIAPETGVEISVSESSGHLPVELDAGDAALYVLR